MKIYKKIYMHLNHKSNTVIQLSNKSLKYLFSENVKTQENKNQVNIYEVNTFNELESVKKTINSNLIEKQSNFNSLPQKDINYYQTKIDTIIDKKINNEKKSSFLKEVEKLKFEEIERKKIISNKIIHVQYENFLKEINLLKAVSFFFLNIVTCLGVFLLIGWGLYIYKIIDTKIFFTLLDLEIIEQPKQ